MRSRPPTVKLSSRLGAAAVLAGDPIRYGVVVQRRLFLAERTRVAGIGIAQNCGIEGLVRVASLATRRHPLAVRHPSGAVGGDCRSGNPKVR
jgi:hypothetical protein